MHERTLNNWPAHMQAVFARIGTLMDGRRLSPDLLARLPENCLDIVEGHRITVRHTSGAEIGTKHGRYTVEMVGWRIDGRWHLSSGQMEKLSREASSVITSGR